MIYKMAGKLDPFARIPHTLLTDSRLSWKAKGILAYLCGKPDGWKMRVADLVKQGTDGKSAVRAALDELRAHGYAEYVQPRASKGAFLEGEWKISDSPIFSPLTDFRDAEKPDAGNRDHSKKELSKKYCRKKESKESKETPSVEGARDVQEFDATWKPISGTKAEQLRVIRPPRDYPSERVFDEYIETAELDHIGMGKRGDLYGDLCDRKWQHWNGRRWHAITDWRAYVAGLDAKMEEATGRF